MRRSAALEEAMKAAATHRRWVVKQEENSALVEAGALSPDGAADPLPRLESSLCHKADFGPAAAAMTRQVLFAAPPPEEAGLGRDTVPPSYVAATQRAVSALGLQHHMDVLGEEEHALLASGASWAAMMGGAGSARHG